MATLGRAEILGLYRQSLRAAQRFETYNFREYFIRRTRDRFRAVKAAGSSEAAERGVQEAQSELSIMRRQGELNRMFSHTRTVLEVDGGRGGRAARSRGV
ncbi:LYR motif-containing protein 4 [Coemansia sp. RSA 2322]|uniref:LYR motif-containing protein 4 n=1 Tax=Coemansia thaxteri TaxID=2663907 RepID=A0A9W8BDQ5_9FUNG|nr:LYR motif-containing protein 4 [Coemansia thaxteri]KAJ2467752.1 LYR motif-containing protein 4 [Coemansia sp. RSA 2322]KAJ2478559.1 LYR motif-containing protein 4 [Coemansia sp. RSA 2320]